MHTDAPESLNQNSDDDFEGGDPLQVSKSDASKSSRQDHGADDSGDSDCSTPGCSTLSQVKSKSVGHDEDE
jgi:hypothetical protein